MLASNHSLFQFDILLQFNMLHDSLITHQRTSQDKSFGNHRFQFIQRYMPSWQMDLSILLLRHQCFPLMLT